MTIAPVDVCGEAEARALTDEIRTAVERTWALIQDAYARRVWLALGYHTWDGYCQAEFASSRLRLPREERARIVASLRESGMSLRAIASATGDSEPTVRRALAGASHDAPERPDQPSVSDVGECARPAGALSSDAAPPQRMRLVNLQTGEDIEPGAAGSETVVGPQPASMPQRTTGTDGRSYPASSSHKGARKPLGDVAKTRITNLRGSMDSLVRIFDDSRYADHEAEIADVLRDDLRHVAETAAAVLAQLPQPPRTRPETR